MRKVCGWIGEITTVYGRRTPAVHTDYIYQCECMKAGFSNRSGLCGSCNLRLPGVLLPRNLLEPSCYSSWGTAPPGPHSSSSSELIATGRAAALPYVLKGITHLFKNPFTSTIPFGIFCLMDLLRLTHLLSHLCLTGHCNIQLYFLRLISDP